MPKLSDLSFREYVGRPLVVSHTLTRETIAGLVEHLQADPSSQLTPGEAARVVDRWDYEAEASLAWPRVDHDEGILLTFLCPCRVTAGEITVESDYDLYSTHGLAINLPAAAHALDCELIAVLDWDELPEHLKDQTRWMAEMSEDAPGVLAAREDERLDPWREANYPDVVQTLLFTQPGIEPAPLWVRVERPATELGDQLDQQPHWVATVAQTPDGGCAAQEGDEVLVGIACNEAGAPLGLYALLQQEISADDYDPEYDRAEGGDLSLSIGSRYYREGMDTSDEEDHDHRIECFRLAEHFYQLSADLGNAQAMCNLGYIYAFGRLGADDQALAATCYRRAADLGHAEAAYKYADQLRYGRGVERDTEQAYFYYEMAYQRAQGESEHPATWGSAALRLADCCEHGVGCREDIDRARDLYLEAESGLQQVVQEEPWYGKQLARAREGAARLAAQ